MKQAEIRRYRAAEPTNLYQAMVWSLLMAVFLLSGALLSMNRLWADWTPPMAEILTAAALSALCGAAASVAAKRYPMARWLWLLPLPVVLVLTGFRGYAAGAQAWVNDMVARWNAVHEGGLLLFSGTASERDMLAFALLAAVIIGMWAWHIVSRHSSSLAVVCCAFWLLLSLLGEAFYPMAAALVAVGLLGIMLSDGAGRITRRALAWFVVLSASLCACAAGLDGADMQSVDRLRETLIQGVHDFRYGKSTLPEGDLTQASLLHESDKTMLEVTTEQEKALYLRGFVGGEYESGKWEPLPDSAYSGDNAGILDWLEQQGFDPFMQSAEYYRLTGGEDIPETNTVQVTVKDASRDTVYAPASLEQMTSGEVRERRDSTLRGRGLFGLHSYTVDEVSGSHPAELMVAEDWVSDPQNEEQTAYAEAESVYRSFVYEKYSAVDKNLRPLLDSMFWEDYDSENDGIYSALSRIREVLKRYAQYNESAPDTPEGEDPIAYFLTESHEGNAMLYASAAVQAFRAHGIPARYVEGYYLPLSKTQEDLSGTIELTGENAHAWAEVYFDGVGWLPIDVTPGYYFDAVALQQMVGLPDTVHKTAAIDENQSSADQVVESSGSGLDAADLQPSFTVVKNVAGVGFGLIGVVLLLATLTLCALEIIRAFVLWNEERKRRRMTAGERVQQTSRLMFKLIFLWGIDAALGWETAATDRRLAETLPAITLGEYQRICGMLEKTVYGGLELEPYEERALDRFVQLLWGRNTKKSWKMRLKLHYACLISVR